jgi:broad specificity phosphatase PhoE
MVVRMTRVYMVRHGRAAAGWNVDPDPGLDELGRSQSLAVATKLSPLGPLPVMSSPLLRCQQTAFPLSTAWKQDVVVDALVGEIPSPAGYALEDRVEWLREAMSGTWAQVAERSGIHYAQYRDAIGDRVRAITTDTVIFSHFIAINAVIGVATNNDAVVIASLDNCSVTTFEVHGDGRLELIEVGGEADTLIR